MNTGVRRDSRMYEAVGRPVLVHDGKGFTDNVGEDVSMNDEWPGLRIEVV